MASHRAHPDPSRLADGLEPILYDDRERCREHAADPLTLDSDFTRAAWARMVEVERHGGSYRSKAEAELCHRLYHMAVWLERHAGLPVWDAGFVR
jgi:hypothetical protein